MENRHTDFRNSISLTRSYKPNAIDEKITQDQILDTNISGKEFDFTDNFTNVNEIPIVALRQEVPMEKNIQNVKLQLPRLHATKKPIKKKSRNYLKALVCQKSRYDNITAGQ